MLQKSDIEISYREETDDLGRPSPYLTILGKLQYQCGHKISKALLRDSAASDYKDKVISDVKESIMRQLYLETLRNNQAAYRLIHKNIGAFQNAADMREVHRLLIETLPVSF